MITMQLSTTEARQKQRADDADRQALYRVRKRRAGFKNMLVWIKPGQEERLRAYIKRLQREHD